MCQALVSQSWVVKHLTNTIVKKFHRRKRNRRAFNKLYKQRDYYFQLGSSVGISFELLKINKQPKLFVRRLKKEELEVRKEPQHWMPVKEISPAC